MKGRGRPDSRGQVGNVKHGYPDNGAPLSKGENSKNYNYYQQQTIDQPLYYTSSIYYGGQDEVYSPTTRPSESHFKKSEQDDDPNSASRGNWWQGSLYY
ncbi:26 kDa periplasmic immunogenic protein [Bienertia sinuspersici]